MRTLQPTPLFFWILGLIVTTNIVAQPTLRPLTELGTDTYHGFTGGLYPGGQNEMPATHATIGTTRANRIQPRDGEGRPNLSNGRYVLLSIGMSNTAQEFCTRGVPTDCEPWSFTGQAEDDARTDERFLELVNGAKGGQVAETWDEPTDENYDRIRDRLLLPQGLSESQVQVAWIKVAHRSPTTSLPAADADAFLLMERLGHTMRTLKQRYPNLQMVFLSSRVYGGYALGDRNPEPYAYESGFAVKWLIEAQMRQMETGEVDPRAGDLDYTTVAPWLAWGPYLWANGETPRAADGLTWLREDFEADGVHPSKLGETKVGEILLDFFKTSSFTRDWFNSNVLPVELTQFRALTDGSEVLLDWATASETQNAGFAIETQPTTSRDDWREVAFVTGAGTTTEPQTYRYRVTDLRAGTHLLRLKQVDTDGTIFYSDAVEVDLNGFAAATLASAYPNPFAHQTAFTLTVAQPQQVRIAVWDALGRQVETLHDGPLSSDGPHRFQWEGQGRAAGIYFIRAEGERFAETQQVVLQ